MCLIASVYIFGEMYIPREGGEKEREGEGGKETERMRKTCVQYSIWAGPLGGF